MEYAVNDLVREVRVCIDQNMTSEALSGLGDVDTLSLEDIIRSKIADAARVVERAAPAHLLDSGRAFACSIGWDNVAGVGSGHIHLPDNFLRLVCFQMSDWSHAVYEPIGQSDPLYARQHSRFPGLRGSPQRPVVAIVGQPIGQVLEFYSCTAGEDVFVKQARYIPIPRIKPRTNVMTGETNPTGEDVIDLCEKLKPSIVYYTAYQTALTIGDEKLAAAMLGTSKDLMEVESGNGGNDVAT